VVMIGASWPVIYVKLSREHGTSTLQLAVTFSVD
jgi:hypothetical protein